MNQETANCIMQRMSKYLDNEGDFRKTAMDYLMFQQGIDAKEFGDKLLTAAMYSSDISMADGSVSISIKR